MDMSALHRARCAYIPKLPPLLRGPIEQIGVDLGAPTEALADREALRQRFPHSYGMPIAQLSRGARRVANVPLRVGVVLSGGQAPGGHNVIAGLFDGLRTLHPDAQLWGFVGGPGGIIEDRAIELTPDYIDRYRNTGGFDMIGSGRTKIESEEQFATTLTVCRTRALNAIVIIGGDDSNTNAALLAEYFIAHGGATAFIGVPKTIDGDLKSGAVEASFGFDSATRTYSELIANICRDANSARKYWHFIRLMGRSASHIALECALQTQPNLCLISEEVAHRRMTLQQLVEQIGDAVCSRAAKGDNFGVVLVPEGLIDAIPEFKTLIAELNEILATERRYFATLNTFETQAEFINKKLSRDSSYIFSSLPNEIQRQLLMDRDPHGNVQVSRIETEKLLTEMVGNLVDERRINGTCKAVFSPVHHFLGYEGRSGFPSNFDADYCYSLGSTACLLLANGLTGYLTTVANLARPADEWRPGGIPLTMMMNMEQRHGEQKPVIRKALVDLQGAPFRRFAATRGSLDRRGGVPLSRRHSVLRPGRDLQPTDHNLTVGDAVTGQRPLTRSGTLREDRYEYCLCLYSHIPQAPHNRSLWAIGRRLCRNCGRYAPSHNRSLWAVG